MLIDVYVIWTIITFMIFFVGLTDLIKLARGTRMTLMFISGILFFILTFSSFSIESVFCTYSTDWLCYTQTNYDYSLGILNILFGVLSIIYIMTDAFGWIPHKELPGGLSE